MTTLFEDLKVALQQICRALGMRGTAAAVVPLVVLGVALNVVALSTMEHVRNQRHPGDRHTALRSAARTELKVVRTVLVSTLKKMDDGRRRWCLAGQWMMNQRNKVRGYMLQVRLEWAAPSIAPNIKEGCDVEVVSISHRKMATAFAQC
ncbi:MAG: hypothetical protein ABSA39_07810 [Edaphobacter sp.]